MQIHHIPRDNFFFPKSLKKLHQPVKELFVRGNPEILSQPSLAVVGSRAVTPYGKEVTSRIISELAWSINVTVISGLALGVDSIAHRAALESKGTTIAVLPGGIENIYPPSHLRLAEQIIALGGALVSEHAGAMQPRKFHFIARNRIIAGLADAVLVTEATKRSGSLHTAQFALEDGKEVMAVPGSIFSPYSQGTNRLIATGAQMIQGSQDIIDLFNNTSTGKFKRGDDENEQTILDLIDKGINRTHQLQTTSRLSISLFNQTLTMLEITGKAKNNGHGQWSRT